jgi:hypothetical protein
MCLIFLRHFSLESIPSKNDFGKLKWISYNTVGVTSVWNVFFKAYQESRTNDSPQIDHALTI